MLLEVVLENKFVKLNLARLNGRVELYHLRTILQRPVVIDLGILELQVREHITDEVLYHILLYWDLILSSLTLLHHLLLVSLFLIVFFCPWINDGNFSISDTVQARNP